MHAQGPEVVKVLLENGAGSNLVPSGGWTPLMYALQNYESFRNSADSRPQREIAEMLVTSGARLDSRNQHGLDAFYYTQDDALKERLRVLAQQHQPAH